MTKYAFILLMMFSLLSCFDEDQDHELEWNDPDITYFKCIWNNAAHCAFTDLVEYNNIYYCAFREGHNHIPTKSKDYGKIRILKSLDGNVWTSTALIEDPTHDLRDPKLTITPKNELMLLYGKSLLEDSSPLKSKCTSVTFGKSTQGGDLKFGATHDIILSRKWLWRIVWHNNIAYGVAYSAKQSPILVRSNDGILFEEICDFTNIIGANEADIIFTKNDQMTIIIRAESGNGYYSKSDYPYDKWQWKTLNHLIHSPKLISLDTELFVTGRGSKGGNILYHIEPKLAELKPLYIFPGGGDTGYPGAIQVDNELWISYYTTYYGVPSIYLSKIYKEAILEKVNK